MQSQAFKKKKKSLHQSNKVHLLWTCYGLPPASGVKNLRGEGGTEGLERWRLLWMWDSWRTVSLLSIIITQRDGSPPTVVIQPPLCLLSRVVPYGRTHQCSIWHHRARRQTGLKPDTCVHSNEPLLYSSPHVCLLWSITALLRGHALLGQTH